MYTICQRVDMFQTHKNQLVAENWERVLTIFRAVLFLARQNLSLRGHNETLTFDNQGNFLELVHLLGRYNPYLSCYLHKISENAQNNRLTFLSNDSQYKMLEILSDGLGTNFFWNKKKWNVCCNHRHYNWLSNIKQLAFEDLGTITRHVLFIFIQKTKNTL